MLHIFTRCMIMGINTLSPGTFDTLYWQVGRITILTSVCIYGWKILSGMKNSTSTDYEGLSWEKVEIVRRDSCMEYVCPNRWSFCYAFLGLWKKWNQLKSPFHIWSRIHNRFQTESWNRQEGNWDLCDSDLKIKCGLPY